jgi:biotin carboxylase
LVGFEKINALQKVVGVVMKFIRMHLTELRKKSNHTQLFGNQLREEEGYKGYFELDFLIDQDNGEIYLGELNPRVAVLVHNHAVLLWQMHLFFYLPYYGMDGCRI